MTSRSAAEAAELDKYHKEGVKQIANVKVAQGGIYAVAFRPDGKVLAAAGGRRNGPADQPRDRLARQGVAPVTVKTTSVAPERTGHGSAAQAGRSRRDRGASQGREPGGSRGSARGDPAEQSVRLCPAPRDRASWPRARRSTSTRMVETSASGGDRRVSRSGLVRPKADGKGDADGAPGAARPATVPVTVLGLQHAGACRFRARCCPGACRGSAATREPATARPRARTASSFRSAATIRSSTCGPDR